jgi:hypothetical protein
MNEVAFIWNKFISGKTVSCLERPTVVSYSLVTYLSFSNKTADLSNLCRSEQRSHFHYYVDKQRTQISM